MRRNYHTITLALVFAGLVLATTRVSAQVPIQVPIRSTVQWWYPTEVYGPLVYGPPAEDGSRAAEYCVKAVGKRVQVEGIGWVLPSAAEGRKDLLSPPDAPRVIFEGGSINVRGADFTKAKVHGKLVRIGGTIKPYGELNARIKEMYRRVEQAERMDPDLALIAAQQCWPDTTPRRPPPPKYFYIKITSLEIVANIVEPKIVLQTPEDKRK